MLHILFIILLLWTRPFLIWWFCVLTISLVPNFFPFSFVLIEVWRPHLLATVSTIGSYDCLISGPHTVLFSLVIVLLLFYIPLIFLLYFSPLYLNISYLRLFAMLFRILYSTFHLLLSGLTWGWYIYFILYMAMSLISVYLQASWGRIPIWGSSIYDLTHSYFRNVVSAVVTVTEWVFFPVTA